jgi:phospholipid transport system transporter-binding protein
VSEPAAPLRIDRIDASNVRVAGEIAFANAAHAVARTSELFAGAGDVTIDLGGLARADSATLGVLLIWTAAAAMRGVRFRFTNAPAGLKALAHLCDVEPLLGLA